jgi:hypothetical protein
MSYPPDPAVASRGADPLPGSVGSGIPAGEVFECRGRLTAAIQNVDGDRCHGADPLLCYGVGGIDGAAEGAAEGIGDGVPGAPGEAVGEVGTGRAGLGEANLSRNRAGASG